MLDAVRHISRSRLEFTRCGFVPAFRQKHGQQTLHDIGLLVAIETAGEASPEDPPVDFVLRLVAELQAAGVDAARLLDAEIVADEAEAGAKTEAAEIEPADLVGCAASARVGEFEEDVGQTPCHSTGQELRPSPRAASRWAGSSSGAIGALRERCANQFAGGVDGFGADHGSGFARSRWLRGGLAHLELQTPAIVADLWNRTRFRACRFR